MRCAEVPRALRARVRRISRGWSRFAAKRAMRDAARASPHAQVGADHAAVQCVAAAGVVAVVGQGAFGERAEVRHGVVERQVVDRAGGFDHEVAILVGEEAAQPCVAGVAQCEQHAEADRARRVARVAEREVGVAEKMQRVGAGVAQEHVGIGVRRAGGPRVRSAEATASPAAPSLPSDSAAKYATRASSFARRSRSQSAAAATPASPSTFASCARTSLGASSAKPGLSKPARRAAVRPCWPMPQMACSRGKQFCVRISCERGQRLDDAPFREFVLRAKARALVDGTEQRHEFVIAAVREAFAEERRVRFRLRRPLAVLGHEREQPLRLRREVAVVHRVERAVVAEVDVGRDQLRGEAVDVADRETRALRIEREGPHRTHRGEVAIVRQEEVARITFGQADARVVHEPPTARSSDAPRAAGSRPPGSGAAVPRAAPRSTGRAGTASPASGRSSTSRCRRPRRRRRCARRRRRRRCCRR